MYPKWMKLIFFYFDFWGFYSEFAKWHQLCVHLIFIFYVIFGSIIIKLLPGYLILLGKDRLGTMNDLFKIVIALMVFWSSLIESYSKRKSLQQFWKIYEKIDTDYCTQCSRTPNAYIWIFILYIPMITIIYIFYYICDGWEMPTELICIWILFTILVLRIQNRIFYYLFYLEIIKSELKVIQREIKRMVFSSRNNNRLREKFELKRFKWLREYYSNVYELGECVNDVFGWSNLIVILCLFHAILYYLNNLYWYWYNGKEALHMNGQFYPNAFDKLK